MKRITRILPLFVLLLALLTVSASASAEIAVKRVAVKPLRTTLRAGRDGKQLTPTLYPAAATARDVTWTSAKPDIASVDANGFVTPLAPGRTRVVCTAESGARASCVVQVKAVPVTGVTLSPAKLLLFAGETANLTAAVAPSDATNQTIVWSSSKPGVASVSSDGAVTAKKPGKAKITATAKSGVKASVAVKVVEAVEHVYYLAIAQEDYTYYTPLPGTLNDAKLFEKALVNCSFGKSAPIKGAVVSNLTAAQMRGAIAALPGKYNIGKNDVTYLYYSGHGAYGDTVAQRGALIGVQGKGDYLQVDEVKALLDAIPGRVVVAFDSCYSGQYVEAKGLTDTRAGAADFANSVIAAFSQSAATSPYTAKGTTTLTEGGNTGKYKILVACQPLELSWMPPALGGYSAFTFYTALGAGVTPASVLETLPADKNGDGCVTLPEMQTYAAPRILSILGGIKQNMMTWPTSDTFPVFARSAS